MKTGGFSCGKESLLQEVNTQRETKQELFVGRGGAFRRQNGAFRRAEAELSVGRNGAFRRAEAELSVGRNGAFRRAEAELSVGQRRVAQGSNGQPKVRRSESRKQQGSGIAEPERTVNDDRKHCKDLTRERA